MRRIQNKQNGRIAQITDTYEKGGQVITYELTYEDDGKTTNLSSSTVKRWWKDIEPTEQDAVALSVEVAPKAVEEDVAGDGTPYSQILTEILEDEKVAVEKKRVKKDEKSRKNGKNKVVATESDVLEVLDYIDTVAADVGMTYYVRDKQPNHRNYKPEGGKVQFTVHVGKTSAEMYLKAFQVPDEVQPKLEVLNGFFNRRLVISELTETKKSVINRIINNFKEVK